MPPLQNLRLVAVVFEDSRMNLVMAMTERKPRVGVLDRVEGGLRLAVTREEIRAGIAALMLMLYPDGSFDPSDSKIEHRANVVLENWRDSATQEDEAAGSA